VKTLVFERNLARFAASRVVSSFGSGRAAGIGPLRLVDADPPAPPGPGWHAVRPLLSGICGSDLAALDGRSSRYFEELVSFPFVPGHEVVGRLEEAATASDGTELPAGSRVVLEPVLGCAARELDPPCDSCARGDTGDCQRVAFGHLRPGLQTGFCADTGGGWSAAGLVAHNSQLHRVPDPLDDEDAVTVEPIACAVHAILASGGHEDDVVAVVGAGMVGLAVVTALGQLAGRGMTPAPGAVLVGGRYSHQRRLAEMLGASEALDSDQLSRAVRRRSRSFSIGTSPTRGAQLTGGADIVFDCVGSGASLSQSLAIVRPRGKVVLVGMPSRASIDLAPLWHREIALIGAYAYGTERVTGGMAPFRTFPLAIEVASAAHTGRLVSAGYPLDRFEEALRHAGGAGHRGAVRVVFDLRRDATAKGRVR
jgi:threonine dehydrogenase-like Zn-dependent dehydrogenase